MKGAKKLAKLKNLLNNFLSNSAISRLKKESKNPTLSES